MTQSEQAAEVRPGVLRPDWFAARSEGARRALGERAESRVGLLDKWMQALDPAGDAVWQSTVRLYADFGRPPTPAELSQATGLLGDEVNAHLRELEKRDLLKMRADGSIQYAYPFTDDWTGHTVTVNGREISSLCAIDALGTGAMLGTDVSVHSTCRYCGKDIHVVTSDRGTRVESATPAGTVVWYDCSYGESAASSCCQSIAFFCGRDHQHAWLRDVSGGCGVELALPEALEVGRAIFAPVLRKSHLEVDREASR